MKDNREKAGSVPAPKTKPVQNMPIAAAITPDSEGFTTFSEAFGWIEGLVNLEKNIDPVKRKSREYRLDRMRALLELFNHPEQTRPTIHVAGSKGKGSTSRLIAGLLSGQGLDSGLYASPHLLTYGERISLNGAPFKDEVYLKQINRIYNTVFTPESTDSGESERFKEWGGPPTTFEILTLLGFLVFEAQNCPWMVLETGLGGRLDATNVCSPEITVITTIELEHTDILGDTIAKIAAEKGGIIKSGIPVVCGILPDEAENVIRKIAEERKAPVYFLKDYLTRTETQITRDGMHTRFFWKKPLWNQGPWKNLKETELTLSMQGAYQATNTALALLSQKVLQDTKKIPNLTDKSLAGLSDARLPGRFDKVQDSPVIIIDGAHTPNSVEGTIKDFTSLYGQEGVAIFGAVDGKDTAGMVKKLKGNFSKVIVSRPGTFKKSQPEHVFQLCREEGLNTELEIDPVKALNRAIKWSDSNSAEQKPILVTGSFYMAAEIEGARRANWKQEFQV